MINVRIPSAVSNIQSTQSPSAVIVIRAIDTQAQAIEISIQPTM